MYQPDNANSEKMGLINDERTPDLLKQALRLFSEADARLARDVADKLDELCEKRWAASHAVMYSTAAADVATGELKAEFLDEKCDAITGSVMKYLGKLVEENQRTGGTKLVLFAAARSLICTSANMSGVEEGLRNARVVFEETLRDLTPVLREMSEEGN